MEQVALPVSLFCVARSGFALRKAAEVDVTDTRLHGASIPIHSEANTETWQSVENTSSQTPAYDTAGNLTRLDDWLYTYDAFGRIQSMERPGLGTNNQPLAAMAIAGMATNEWIRLEFRYDAQHRRVEKSVKQWTTGSWTLQRCERYLYDGWNMIAMIAMIDATTGTPRLRSQYFWRTGSDSSGAFGLLAIAGDHDGNPATAAEVFLPGYDGRGNLTTLASGATGQVAAVFEYDPYGQLLREEWQPTLIPKPTALGAHFGFATQFTDRESGLVYYGYRYYSPRLGRFLTLDPLYEQGGRNRYAYVGNNPVNAVDYRGLCTEDTDDVLEAVYEWLSAIYGAVEDYISSGSGQGDDDDIYTLDDFEVTAPFPKTKKNRVRRPEIFLSPIPSVPNLLDNTDDDDGGSGGDGNATPSAPKPTKEQPKQPEWKPNKAECESMALNWPTFSKPTHEPLTSPLPGTGVYFNYPEHDTPVLSEYQGGYFIALEDRAHDEVLLHQSLTLKAPANSINAQFPWSFTFAAEGYGSIYGQVTTDVNPGGRILRMKEITEEQYFALLDGALNATRSGDRRLYPFQEYCRSWSQYNFETAPGVETVVPDYLQPAPYRSQPIELNYTLQLDR